MKLQEIWNLAQQSGMVVCGKHLFGEGGGYPFSCAIQCGKAPEGMEGEAEVNGAQLHFLLGAPLDRKNWKQVVSGLKNLMASGFLSQDRLHVSASIRGDGAFVWNQVLQVVPQIASQLAFFQVPPPSVCPVCRQTGCDALAYTSGSGYGPVHRACVEQSTQKTLKSITDNQYNGNYGLGIIGALLGGLVGSIPTLLLMYFMEKISAWLYILIPLGAYFGYKLLKGKMSKAVAPIVIVVSFLMVFVVEQAFFYLQIHKYHDVWPSLWETIRFYFQEMTFADMMADMAMPLLFTVFGVVASTGQILVNNSVIGEGVDLTLRSMVVKREQTGDRKETEL